MILRPLLLWFALTAVVLTAGCGSKGSGGAPPPSEEAVLRAEVDAQPANPRPRLLLVRHLAVLGRRCDALDEARAAFKAFPESGPARSTLAQVLGDHQRYAEAAALLRPLAAANPESRLQLGRYLLRAGDLEGAAAAVAPLQGGAAFAFEAGQLCLDALRFDAAVRFFQSASRRAPDDGDLQAYVGLALLLSGRPREALPPLEAAVRLGSAPAAYYLGAARRQAGSPAGALEPLREAVAREPRAGLQRYELGLALLATGDVAGAEKELREAALLQPSAAELQRDLSRVYQLRGNSASSAGARARYLRLLGDGRAAAELLERAVRSHPGSIPLTLELAEAHYDAWETPRTLALLTALRSRHPQRTEVLEALFRAQKAAHRYGDALETLEALIRSTPGDLGRLDQKAELLQLLGRYQDLEALLEELRQREPSAPARHYRYGLALAQWSARPDREAVAEAAFRETLRLDPAHADAHYRLGLLHLGRQQLAEATTSLRRCLDTSPRHADALQALSRGYALQGDSAAAQSWREAYRKVKKVQDQEARLKQPGTLRVATPAERRALGLFYLGTARYEQAISELEAAEHFGALAPADRRVLADLYGHSRRFQRMAEMQRTHRP